MPEVETVRRGLAKTIVDKVINDVNIISPKIIKYPLPEEFVSLIKGKNIEKVDRKGKYLLVGLCDEYFLVMHLRMAGQLVYSPPEENLPKHTHVILYLSDGNWLHLSDIRGFATMHLLKSDELDRISGLANLGPEPLSREFTVEYLKKVIANKKSKIKSIILDQTNIAGIGNIYADESLHRARINPERQGGSLNDEEIDMLHDAINEVIGKGIEHRGTSVRDYRDATGEKGDFQNYLRVYRRLNQPCVECDRPIQRIEVGGRGTYFCPNCQPASE